MTVSGLARVRAVGDGCCGGSRRCLCRSRACWNWCAFGGRKQREDGEKGLEESANVPLMTTIRAVSGGPMGRSGLVPDENRCSASKKYDRK